MNKKNRVTPLTQELVSRNYITEFFQIDTDSIQKIVDAQGNAVYTTFRALAQKIDTKNDNKRIYLQEAIDEALDIVKQQITKKMVYCLVDHPDPLERVKIKNAGAYVTGVEVDGKNIYITGKFIDNAAFREHLKPLLDSGARVGLSVRGYTINSGNPEYNEEQDAFIYKKGYRIDGWDFVLQAAVEDAEVLTLEEREQEISKNNNHEEEKIMDFKTLSEVRAHFPQLFVEDDAARKNSIDAIVNEKVAIDAKLNAALDSNKAMTAKYDEKVKENETLAAKLKTTEASLDAVKSEIDNIKFKSELEKVVADCKYKEYITIPSHINKIEDAKKYLTDEVARLDNFLAAVKPTESATPAPKAPAAQSGAADDKSKTPVLDEQDRWLMSAGAQKAPASATK